ncbi:MAG: hypothetical protein EBV24_09480 [Actinobacteria bacterium]|nr:hypothetical protein [Actinomycetota bacterium]
MLDRVLPNQHRGPNDFDHVRCSDPFPIRPCIVSAGEWEASNLSQAINEWTGEFISITLEVFCGYLQQFGVSDDGIMQRQLIRECPGNPIFRKVGMTGLQRTPDLRYDIRERRILDHPIPESGSSSRPRGCIPMLRHPHEQLERLPLVERDGLTTIRNGGRWPKYTHQYCPIGWPQRRLWRVHFFCHIVPLQGSKFLFPETCEVAFHMNSGESRVCHDRSGKEQIRCSKIIKLLCIIDSRSGCGGRVSSFRDADR